MNDKEFCDYIHLKIHALRMIQNYKPSQAELDISKKVIEKYKDSCIECKEREDQLKNQPEKDKNFFGKIGDLISP